MKTDLLDRLDDEVSDVIGAAPTNGPGTESATSAVTPTVSRIISPPMVILPSGSVTISHCAAELFSLIAPTRTMFLWGGTVTTLDNNSFGQPVLKPLLPAAARSRFEKHARFFAWRSGEDRMLVLKPTICAEGTAKAFIATCEARDLLPKLNGLINCPFIKEVDGKLAVTDPGFDETTGLFVTGGETPAIVPLDKAVESILDLLSEFSFQTPGDHSRAIAAILTPALKIGGMIKSKVPVDVAEADQSQSGKTYRQKLVAAIYNENVAIISQKIGGVGSVDESLSARLIEGRPFIQLDNFRGRFDSPNTEALLTAEKSFYARIPHSPEVEINPNRFFVSLTSNGVETTPDMANRSSIIRIRKREGFITGNNPEGDLLAHIRANQPYYLGCCVAIVEAWFDAGKPQSQETRHDFREWCQILDCIVQTLFGAAPLMDGHAGAQERVSNPGLTFVRKLCLAIEEEDKLGSALCATQLYKIAEDTCVEVPGLHNPDEDKGAKRIGTIMGKLFKTNNEVDVEGFRIRRLEAWQERDDPSSGGAFKQKTYVVMKS